MIIKVIFFSLLVEALVELFFKAVPLQGIRQWLIKKTPFLNSTHQGHLLDCKYCTSLWIAFGVIMLATWFDNGITRIIALFVITGRISNYIHIIWSTARDLQLNMRLARRK
jgi:hypothetical protein